MGTNKILVIGSTNVDMVIKMKKLPLPGETVGNGKFEQSYGGKGANQALAAAKQNVNTEFITCLGNDSHAKKLEEYFRNNLLITNRILYSDKSPTGIALIYVSEDGENCIALAPGANEELTMENLSDWEQLFKNVELLVLQAEIPLLTIENLILKAKEKNIKVLFNPAPVCRINKHLLTCIDYLVVNKGELEEISGEKVDSLNLKTITGELLKKGCKHVIVTLGKEGVFYHSDYTELSVKAFPVEAVDTTGAGDTFCGVLAACIAEKETITTDILKYCCAASAISVTRMGAQPSIPSKDETKQFFHSKYNQ
ncbi:ribokinase [Apibacter raozihei]|uniref:ribokinase n=1 Tax=Apibacter raozihei TaxID=2500547 RepID=UPI000FE3E0F6|nr:ribokinase [Apibacter raozihei]